MPRRKQLHQREPHPKGQGRGGSECGARARPCWALPSGHRRPRGCPGGGSLRGRRCRPDTSPEGSSGKGSADAAGLRGSCLLSPSFLTSLSAAQGEPHDHAPARPGSPALPRWGPVPLCLRLLICTGLRGVSWGGHGAATNATGTTPGKASPQRGRAICPLSKLGTEDAMETPPHPA